MTQSQVYDFIASLSKDKNLNTDDLEKELVDKLVKALSSAAITTGGRITGLDTSAGAIVTKTLKEFYNGRAYKNSIAKFLKDIKVANTQKLSVYKDSGLNISTEVLNTQQNLSIDEYLDNLSDNGLNSKFNQPIRQLIYDSVRNNASLSDLRDSLNDKILSGKAPSELSKYVKNATKQAADSYTSIVDKEIYKKFENRVTHYQMVGTLIETSSPQCRQAVEKYDRFIPIEELADWISFAQENGGSAELNASNLPVLKAHYGCRHQFIPYISEVQGEPEIKEPNDPVKKIAKDWERGNIPSGQDLEKLDLNTELLMLEMINWKNNIFSPNFKLNDKNRDSFEKLKKSKDYELYRIDPSIKNFELGKEVNFNDRPTFVSNNKDFVKNMGKLGDGDNPVLIFPKGTKAFNLQKNDDRGEELISGKFEVDKIVGNKVYLKLK
jgi:hypothetical protein